MLEEERAENGSSLPESEQISRFGRRLDVPELGRFGFGDASMVVLPHRVRIVMTCEQDELVHILVRCQPKAAKAVSHRAVRPNGHASVQAVFLPVGEKRILAKTGDRTLHLARGVPVRFDPRCGVIWKFGEPALTRFADLRADHDAFGRDIQISPVHQADFLGTNPAKEAKRKEGDQLKIVLERVVEHLLDGIRGNDLNFLPDNLDEVQSGDRVCD